jgi:hypothetical protein
MTDAQFGRDGHAASAEDAAVEWTGVGLDAAASSTFSTVDFLQETEQRKAGNNGAARRHIARTQRRARAKGDAEVEQRLRGRNAQPGRLRKPHRNVTRDGKASIHPQPPCHIAIHVDQRIHYRHFAIHESSLLTQFRRKLGNTNTAHLWVHLSIWFFAGIHDLWTIALPMQSSLAN